ncbi:MAG: extracellular solute-binding protein [Clostridia bacterium]|nr:extracellular solute-binding protein [Clostridia bacterium]
MKRLISILLATLMILALAAPVVYAEHARYNADGKRIITIATWYEIFYDSRHTDIYDDAGLSDPLVAQMRLDNLRAVEEKYNVEIRFENFTWDGVQESISTSIMAGAPDADVYMADVQFGIPAALSNLGVTLQEMGLEDTDIFGDQNVMKYLSIPGIDSNVLFTPSPVTALRTYVLAFNMDMILENNLENPQDLYDRGEWTWDKWREYLTILTKDTTGDGEIDVYGWSGYWTNMLTSLLFSNGTTIAGGPQETLTSTATIEVLEFIYNLYNVDRTARPWDESGWEINNNLYAEGKSAFWVGADWLFNAQGGGPERPLPFEIGVVPWPRGPQGDDATNFFSVPSDNYYFIPRGVEDPRFVYDVMYDYFHWYGDDLVLAGDLEWSMDCYMTERNFEYAEMMARRITVDLWDNLGVASGILGPLIAGEKTPAQFAEENKLLFQDALNNYFR